MSRLSDYRLLCFDVYGTLIDWESGILAALQPILARAHAHFSHEELLAVFHELEHEQQRLTPDMPYSQLLSTIHPRLTSRLGLDVPSEEESRQFGESVGSWPAFPDTVDALKRLSKHYRLVVLSNVDRASFAQSNAGSLQAFPFDLIITAQDIGSYKPDRRNFEHMMRAVQTDFGVERSQILQTAQSQFHDHQPAQKVGIKSVWIKRPGPSWGIRTIPSLIGASTLWGRWQVR
ncbi:Haloacid dehalogenase type II [Penicillium maclennaniae]|uniref:Haloacid dehalogenase type II n=1 Tax=Penicillium maclennaniae TaxID=1343394 RepID=UPI0025421091|nr:Haloacid dehalogenase type II [Penicillium maclennaniae]KAJ5676898.1 Haloacid dehalogenase type II [Penicillium maclennaniae]